MMDENNDLAPVFTEEELRPPMPLPDPRLGGPTFTEIVDRDHAGPTPEDIALYNGFLERLHSPEWVAKGEAGAMAALAKAQAAKKAAERLDEPPA